MPASGSARCAAASPRNSRSTKVAAACWLPKRLRLSAAMVSRQRCLVEAASGVLGVSAIQQRRHPAEPYVFASCICVTFVLVAAPAPLRGLWSSGGRRLIPCRTLDHELHSTIFHIVLFPLHDGAPPPPASVAFAQTQMASAARAGSAPHVRCVVLHALALSLASAVLRRSRLRWPPVPEPVSLQTVVGSAQTGEDY